MEETKKIYIKKTTRRSSPPEASALAAAALVLHELPRRRRPHPCRRRAPGDAPYRRHRLHPPRAPEEGGVGEDPAAAASGEH